MTEEEIFDRDVRKLSMKFDRAMGGKKLNVCMASLASAAAAILDGFSDEEFDAAVDMLATGVRNIRKQVKEVRESQVANLPM